MKTYSKKAELLKIISINHNNQSDQKILAAKLREDEMKSDEKIGFERIPATLRAVFSEQIEEDEDGSVEELGKVK